MQNEQQNFLVSKQQNPKLVFLYMFGKNHLFDNQNYINLTFKLKMVILHYFFVNKFR